LEFPVMAKKKVVKEQEMPAIAEPQIKPVRLDLTPSEHKALRVEAVHMDMSMTALARKLVVEGAADLKRRRKDE
jgi:thioredoxin-related protein